MSHGEKATAQELVSKSLATTAASIVIVLSYFVTEDALMSGKLYQVTGSVILAIVVSWNVFNLTRRATTRKRRPRQMRLYALAEKLVQREVRRLGFPFEEREARAVFLTVQVLIEERLTRVIPPSAARRTPRKKTRREPTEPRRPGSEPAEAEEVRDT